MSTPSPAVDATSVQSTTQASTERTRGVVLVGNPNVGKSAIFNALTGLNAEVSNYPGTTIDVSRGHLGEHELADTPGVYGVSSFNDEERIARELIVEAKYVINVVSALSLDRDLFLTLQLIDLGKPLIVVINQWDEALHRGMNIDTQKLSQILGVPVLTSVAVRNEGIQEIKDTFLSATRGTADGAVSDLRQQFVDAGHREDIVLLALEGDEQAVSSLAPLTVPNHQTALYKARRKRVDSIYGQVVSHSVSAQSLGTSFGRFLLHPIWGSLTALFVCYLIFYQLLGVFVAGTVVEFTEKRGLRVFYEPNVRRVCAEVFPATITVGAKQFDFPAGVMSSADKGMALNKALAANAPQDTKFDFWSHRGVGAVIGNILVGEYGILTLTVTYLFGLLLPLVLGFYFGLSMLEDSGYLPRLAVIVDRWLNKIGLNGRAIIPLILGLGCVTMATVTTRLLTTAREKIIATALLGVAIPCSAQLGIVSGTLAKVGGVLPWVIYGTVIGGILGVTGLLMHKFLPGKSQPLMIDLPPMRLPRANNVLKKTWTKSWNFMKESIPMFCIAGLVVTTAQMTGALALIVKFLEPITISLLGLPADPRIPTTFVLGVVRRDFAAFGLTDVMLTAKQAVIAMIVITLFVPCIATVGVMIKERGAKIAMTIWVGSWLAAFAVGGLLSRLLPPL